MQDVVKLFDKEFVPFISEETIKHKIKEIAVEINRDYKDKKPLFISVLNGAFIFTADLFKELTIEVEVCFIKLASYKGTQSTGHVITCIGLDANIKGRDIIVVEDIIDTGNTLNAFLPQLYNQQPASLKVAVLLYKPDAIQHQVPIDYCCFNIPNKFVLGYGLDYDGYGRNLKEIYQLHTPES